LNLAQFGSSRQKPYQYPLASSFSMPEESKVSTASKEIFRVTVSMNIKNENDKEVDSRTIDFGKMNGDQLKGLTDLFSMMASNVEYIRKLAPQYEKLGSSVPPYLR
jgi:hypothetical protein